MTVEIHGFCDERFKPMKEAFAANFEAGLELGASLAVTHQGRAVVDIWAGWADPERTRPWAEDTLVRVYSTTKAAIVLCALMLVDRGLLDLDAPVARYWPAFAQGGKGAVTVRDALSHRGGVPGLDPPASLDVWLDWSAMTARIAAEPHWFEGRGQIAYHFATFGFLIGELIRRVDGRGPRRFFDEEVAQKLGCDLQIGLSDKSDLDRLARFQWPTEPPPAAEGLLARMLETGPPLTAIAEGPWEALANEDGGGNGFANGRSVARLFAIPAMRGEVDGVRFLSAEIIAEAVKEQLLGSCPYLGPVSMGLGFGLYHAEHFPHGTPSSIGWGGLGGSVGFADPVAGMSFGYAPNNFRIESSAMGPRQVRLAEAFAAVAAPA